MVTVNGEQVIPQPGGFYGGWITSWVVGPFKGIPGSMAWYLDTTSVQLETTPVQIGNPTGEVFVPCCRKLRTRSDVVADVVVRHDRCRGQLHDAR